MKRDYGFDCECKRCVEELDILGKSKETDEEKDGTTEEQEAM